MAFTQSTGLRDREYNRFHITQPGSQTTVVIHSNNNVKVYEFPLGSIRATNIGTNSGGNFDSWTHYRLHGLFYGIEYLHGDLIAAGSIFLSTSGTVEHQLWGTHTNHATNTDFTVFPRGAIVSTDDEAIDLSSGCSALIPMSGILHLIGSDLGKTKSGAGFNIAYI